MKKGHFSIIAIATAMLGAMAFSSCSHDEYYYSETKVEEAANLKYATAFEKAFGKVGANVDWGFGRESANARALTRAGEGLAQPNIEFPEDCDASKFLDKLPEDIVVTKLSENGAGAGYYYIDETTQKVQTWAGISHIYVVGNVDLSDENNATFSPAKDSEIYLLEGSTLKLGTNGAYNFNVVIYIAKNARLETTGLLKVNANSKVYNHGTISVGSFEVNSSSFLYNVGKLETTGSVNIESPESRIVNDGTITSEHVQINTGALQNNGEWTVTGTTVITSNSPATANKTGWINNGHWTTQNFAYTGGSENVITNCLLTVTEDFDMNLSSAVGSFKIDTDGGVLTKNFNGGTEKDANTNAISGPFKIVMGQNAVFKVTETATLESGRGEGFGFFGPSTGDYAVFQAQNIVRDPYLASINSHGAVTYGGKLYVSAKTHFAQGYDSDGSGSAEPKPFIYEHDGFSIANNIYAAGFKSGKPNITIPKTPCSPGFEGDEIFYRVIAEDLSAAEAGDFDFNDVVFDVIKAENGKTTLKLICAGGTLPLRVRGASEAEGVEVHSVFGQTAPDAQGVYQMFNTGAGPTVPEKTFTVEGEYTTPKQIKNIIIEVRKNSIWMPLYATQGEAACKILVDSSFKPVAERRNIANEYGKFTNYVQGTFVDDFWWK